MTVFYSGPAVLGARKKKRTLLTIKGRRKKSPIKKEGRGEVKGGRLRKKGEHQCTFNLFQGGGRTVVKGRATLYRGKRISCDQISRRGKGHKG